eukprot:gene11090-18704_t
MLAEGRHMATATCSETCEFAIISLVAYNRVRKKMMRMQLGSRMDLLRNLPLLHNAVYPLLKRAAESFHEETLESVYPLLKRAAESFNEESLESVYPLLKRAAESFHEETLESGSTIFDTSSPCRQLLVIKEGEVAYVAPSSTPIPPAANSSSSWKLLIIMGGEVSCVWHTDNPTQLPPVMISDEWTRSEPPPVAPSPSTRAAGRGPSHSSGEASRPSRLAPASARFTKPRHSIELMRLGRSELLNLNGVFNKADPFTYIASSDVTLLALDASVIDSILGKDIVTLLREQHIHCNTQIKARLEMMVAGRLVGKETLQASPGKAQEFQDHYTGPAAVEAPQVTGGPSPGAGGPSPNQRRQGGNMGGLGGVQGHAGSTGGKPGKGSSTTKQSGLDALMEETQRSAEAILMRGGELDENAAALVSAHRHIRGDDEEVQGWPFAGAMATMVLDSTHVAPTPRGGAGAGAHWEVAGAGAGAGAGGSPSNLLLAASPQLPPDATSRGPAASQSATTPCETQGELSSTPRQPPPPEQPGDLHAGPAQAPHNPHRTLGGVGVEGGEEDRPLSTGGLFALHHDLRLSTHTYDAAGEDGDYACEGGFGQEGGEGGFGQKPAPRKPMGHSSSVVQLRGPGSPPHRLATVSPNKGARGGGLLPPPAGPPKIQVASSPTGAPTIKSATASPSQLPSASIGATAGGMQPLPGGLSPKVGTQNKTSGASAAIMASWSTHYKPKAPFKGQPTGSTNIVPDPNHHHDSSAAQPSHHHQQHPTRVCPPPTHQAKPSQSSTLALGPPVLQAVQQLQDQPRVSMSPLPALPNSPSPLVKNNLLVSPLSSPLTMKFGTKRGATIISYESASRPCSQEATEPSQLRSLDSSLVANGSTTEGRGNGAKPTLVVILPRITNLYTTHMSFPTHPLPSSTTEGRGLDTQGRGNGAKSTSVVILPRMMNLYSMLDDNYKYKSKSPTTRMSYPPAPGGRLTNPSLKPLTQVVPKSHVASQAAQGRFSLSSYNKWGKKGPPHQWEGSEPQTQDVGVGRGEDSGARSQATDGYTLAEGRGPAGGADQSASPMLSGGFLGAGMPSDTGMSAADMARMTSVQSRIMEQHAQLPLGVDKGAPSMAHHPLSEPTMDDIQYILGRWSERWNEEAFKTTEIGELESYGAPYYQGVSRQGKL